MNLFRGAIPLSVLSILSCPCWGAEAPIYGLLDRPLVDNLNEALLLPLTLDNAIIPGLGTAITFTELRFCEAVNGSKGRAVALGYRAKSTATGRRLTDKACSDPLGKTAEEVAKLAGPTSVLIASVSLTWEPWKYDLRIEEAAISNQGSSGEQFPENVGDVLKASQAAIASVGTADIGDPNSKLRFDVVLGFIGDQLSLMSSPAGSMDPNNLPLISGISFDKANTLSNARFAVAFSLINQTVQKQLASGPFVGQVAGLRFELLDARVQGAPGRLDTGGVIDYKGIRFNVTVTWSGDDLEVSGVSVREAHASCGGSLADRLACESKKAAAILLEGSASIVKGYKLKPSDSRTVQFEFGNRKLAVSEDILRASSGSAHVVVYPKIEISAK